MTKYVFLVLVAVAALAAPYPPGVAAWTTAEKQRQVEAGTRLLADLQAAIDRGDKRFTVPTGDYRFAGISGPRPFHIQIKDAEHFTLDGGGSTFWFTRQATALSVYRCRDVTIRNLTLDWDPLPFTQGTIVAMDPAAATFDVRLDPGYETVTEDFRAATGNGRGVLFDPETRRLKVNQWGFVTTPFWDKRVGEQTYRVGFGGFYDATLDEVGMAVGDKIAMYVRKGRAVRVEVCDGVVFEDVTLYASGFVCIADGVGGSNVYRRVRIVRRPDTDRLIAGNADGINCSNMARGPIIEDCEIEYLGDDFVNVHGHFARVLAQPAGPVVISSRVGFRGALPPGTRLAFYDRLTMKPLGETTVLASETLTWTPEKGTCLNDLDQRWHSGDAASLRYGQPCRAVKFTLLEPIALEGEPIFCSPDFVGAGTVIRNCRFRGSLARGIRLQSPFAEIVNNTIAETVGGGISCQSHPGFWGEGVNVHHTRIAGNTLIDTSIGRTRNGVRYAIDLTSPGDLAVAERQRGIEIAGNTIVRPGGAAVVVRGGEAIRIVGNHIAEPVNFPVDPPTHGATAPAGLGHAIILEDVRAVVVEGNTIDRPGAHAVGDLIEVTP